MTSTLFRADQSIGWLSQKGTHAGRLITWQGPSAAGVYTLTVREAGTDALVTLYSPGPDARAAQNREARRHV